jgi:hypothetical protein
MNEMPATDFLTVARLTLCEHPATAGRVYCKNEALSGPFASRDLLTTSAVRGHAMKDTDKGKSHGTVMGKQCRH